MCLSEPIVIQKAHKDNRAGAIEKTYEVKCLLENFIERNDHDKKQENKKTFLLKRFYKFASDNFIIYSSLHSYFYRIKK